MKHAFLREPYASMEPAALLEYVRERRAPQYLPLAPGKAKHVEEANKLLRHEFTLNNETHRLAEPVVWTVNPSGDIEWHILLHKFYYGRVLGAAYQYTRDERYAKKWVDLVVSWINAVPIDFIDSQVTGRRVQQWLLAYHYFVPTRSESVNGTFLRSFLASIAQQAVYLSNHLTPEGNHRTIELYAIFLVATLFPEFVASAALLECSITEIVKNVETDLLADGVHRELSTDYHHTVLKNYLRIKELAARNGLDMPLRFDSALARALEYSLYVHRPDGKIPAINDGDSNSYVSMLKKAYTYYPDPRLLYVATQGESGVPPAERSKAFVASGYFTLRSAWTARPYSEALYLFFDAASLGFGSHGHYDVLSFEAAAYGHPLIVDPGRYTYAKAKPGDVDWRRYFKGTACHNTIQVDGQDQMHYAHGRPSGVEPQADVLRYVSTPGFDLVHGRVRSPEYSVVHERIILFVMQEYWLVIDLLQAEDVHTYAQYFHLTPRALHKTNVERTQEANAVIAPHLLIVQPACEDAQATIVDGYVSPEYGVREPAPVVRFTHTGRNVVRHTVLYPYQSDRPTVQVRELPQRESSGHNRGVSMTALKLVVEKAGETYVDYVVLGHDKATVEFCHENIRWYGDVMLLRTTVHGRPLSFHGINIECLHMWGRNILEAKHIDRQVTYCGIDTASLRTCAEQGVSIVNAIEHIAPQGAVWFPQESVG